MFDAFIFTDLEMPFTGREKGVLYVGVCSITVEQDCAACICEGVLKAVANSNADLDMAQKFQRGRLFVQEKRTWTTKNLTRVGRACSLKNLAKPKEIVTQNNSEKPDYTNNSLAHPEETLDNEPPRATTHSGHNSRGQAMHKLN